MRLRNLLYWFGLMLLVGCGGGGGDVGPVISGPIVTGVFVDGVVSGVDYTTTSGESGTTNAAGELSYREGDTVTFAIGDLILGSCVGQPLITPADLTANAGTELNLARFLQTIDVDGNPDNGIVIDPAIAAVVDAELAGGAVIDFSLSSPSFASSADLAALLAAIDTVTTTNTATLVSAAAARAHLDATLAGINGTSTFNIDVSAGSGGLTGADNPGGLSLEKTVGSGAIEILATGVADTAFTPTVLPDPDLGPVPHFLTVDTDISIFSRSVDTPPPAGVLYQVSNRSYIYMSDGDSDFFNDPFVTGLSIADGVTLTFNGGISRSLPLDNDLIIHGIITGTDVDATQRMGIDINAENIFNLGMIDVHGLSPGQNGGHVSIRSSYTGSPELENFIINHGSILTYGANNSDGNAGFGGDVRLDGLYSTVENTALIDTHGGTASGTSGSGGGAGEIYFAASYSMFNSGDLRAFGGDGVDSGGDGGFVLVQVSNYEGSSPSRNLLNSGSVDASGGMGKNDYGGAGGDYIVTSRGDFISSGNISLAGGDNADLSGGSLPGAGGSFTLELYPETGFCVSYTGNAIISGDIDLSGGEAVAGPGNAAGQFSVWVDNSSGDIGQKISMRGYGRVDAGGGSGQNQGGNGGTIRITNGGSGPVVNEAALIAHGGDAEIDQSGSIGGSGGTVNLYSAETGSTTLLVPDVSGGAGEVAGSDGTVSIDASL